MCPVRDYHKNMKTQDERNGLETGTVLKTEGPWASVITNKSKSCNECGKAQAGICGKSGAGMVIKARNDAGAKAWDTVLLELDRRTHVRAYFLVFILPVLTLFVSAYAGYLFSQSSGIQGFDAAAGFFGLIVSMAYSLHKIRGLDKTAHLRIKKVLHDTAGFDSLPCSEEMDYLARINIDPHVSSTTDATPNSFSWLSER